MRSVGLAAVLLLFVACKPVVRESVSDLEAVSSGNITLGVVPAESSNGTQAYRLMVCRKSGSYPKWVLEDDNRCRPALLDKADNEVVFLHDELERDFATKYVGYGKGYIVPALVGIGATAAIFGVGGRGIFSRTVDGVDGKGGVVRWTNRGFVEERIAPPVADAMGRVRNWGIFNNKVVNAIIGAPVTVGKAGQWAVSKAVPPWHLMIVARYRWLHLENIIGKIPKVGSHVNVSGSLKEQEEIAKLSAVLVKRRDELKLLKRFQKAKNKDDFIADVQKDLDRMSADDFVNKTNALDKSSPEYIGRMHTLNRIELYKKTIPQMNSSANFGKRIGQLNGEGTNSIKAAATKLGQARANRSFSPLGVSYDALSRNLIRGTAGVALVTMTDLDKSVFGYNDRLTSTHFSQVFSEGMHSDRKVKDLREVLDALADFFGHRVNPHALALGN